MLSEGDAHKFVTGSRRMTWSHTSPLFKLAFPWPGYQLYSFVASKVNLQCSLVKAGH